MKTGYISDEFSTLGGLASVAYGDVDFFREVQNQIINSSPTKTFDSQAPSDIVRSFLPSEEFFLSEVINSLREYYSSNESFSDFIDSEIGPTWENYVSTYFLKELYQKIDDRSSYGATPGDFISDTYQSLFSGFNDISGLSGFSADRLYKNPVLSDDLNLIFNIASNNPKTKLSSPPPNSVIPLLNSIDFDLDYKSLPISSSYLLPQEYFSDIAYPGFKSVSSIPLSLKESVQNGYVGYPFNSTLEQIFNPAGAESLKNITTSVGEALSNSDIWNATSVLGQLENIPGLSQADRDIYEISLMGARINGLLEFDQSSQSNGDFFDVSLLPELQNSDKEGGIPFSSRNFSTAF